MGKKLKKIQKKTTRRKPYTRIACNYCKQKKIRCGGGSPCSPCKKKSITCIYRTDEDFYQDFRIHKYTMGYLDYYYCPLGAPISTVTCVSEPKNYETYVSPYLVKNYNIDSFECCKNETSQKHVISEKESDQLVGDERYVYSIPDFSMCQDGQLDWNKPKVLTSNGYDFDNMNFFDIIK